MTDETTRIHDPQSEGWAEWVRNGADRKAVSLGYYFDIEAAEHARGFFANFLVLTSGKFAGKPFVLQEWQWRDIIGPLFGWKRPDGLRRIRRVFVFVAKKNGKSELAAGIAHYLLTSDGEQSGEVYSAAGTKEQAGIVFDAMAHMARLSPDLSSEITVKRGARIMEHPGSGSRFKALPHDADTVEGLKANAVIIDELHAHKNGLFLESLRHSGASREQPVEVIITTAGAMMDSVCGRTYDYAKKVASGVIENLSYLPVIYEAPKTEDPNAWKRPETWRAANPSMGITMREDDFAEECKMAQDDPSLESSFRRYRLNEWTQGEDAWLTASAWAKCHDPERSPEELRGRRCVAALDLSTVSDFTALALVFDRPNKPGAYDALLKFWIPEDTAVQRESKDKVPIMAWAKAGYIRLTPGNRVDYDIVEADIKKLRDDYGISELAFDPYNATALTNHLADAGMALVEFRQGYISISPAMKAMKRLILGQEFEHFDNPVLKWMAANTIVLTDPAGNIKADKSDPANRIDGIVASIMAVGRAINSEPPSVYAKSGSLAL